MRITIGVDLAQARDATALAAISSYRGEPVETARGRTRRPLHHSLIGLERLPVGTAYPAQVELIKAFADRFAEDQKPTLYVDATGVGRPVLDLLRQGCPHPICGVTIGSGAVPAQSGRDWSVPKADLIGVLDVALSSRRAHFQPGLRLAKDLDKELRAYSYELSATGRAKYEGRGVHDDLVLALALAIWGSEKGGGGTEAFQEMMAAAISTRQEMTHREQ